MVVARVRSRVMGKEVAVQEERAFVLKTKGKEFRRQMVVRFVQQCEKHTQKWRW